MPEQRYWLFSVPGEAILNVLYPKAFPVRYQFGEFCYIPIWLEATFEMFCSKEFQTIVRNWWLYWRRSYLWFFYLSNQTRPSLYHVTLMAKFHKFQAIPLILFLPIALPYRIENHAATMFFGGLSYETRPSIICTWNFIETIL